MTFPLKIVLVRHAESEGNLLNSDDRTKLNIPSYKYKLTPFGKKQAKITGEYLNKIYKFPYGFDYFFSSYYKRAKETMEIIFPNQKYIEDSRLAEAQRGQYHFLSKKEMKLKYKEELKRKEFEEQYHYRPFGGENWADVELRIHSFINTLSTVCFANKRVFIVVHGLWFLLFQRILHGFSIDKTIEIYNREKDNGIVANASITEYRGIDLVRYDYTPWKDKNIYRTTPPWE